MELAKSIKILELNLKVAGRKMPIDCQDALKLGIEALDYLQRERQSNPGVAFTVLKGETPPE